MLFQRGSVSKYDAMLANCVGVVDSGYRGEITFRYRVWQNGKLAPKLYRIGDRIGQLVVVRCPLVVPVETDELSETERGAGGYGSTDRREGCAR